MAGFFSTTSKTRRELFDLRFLVYHVLANRRIVLFRFHLLGVKLLILQRRIEVARAGAGYKFDFFTHYLILRRLDAFP